MNVAARLADSRRSNARFNPVVFILAGLAAAVALVSIVAIPQYLSKQARWDALRSQVGEIGQLAASVVDGDLHRQLLDPANYSAELYARAVKPLVRFHSANPNIFYLYTMVDRGGAAYFVLDTAASPDLHTSRKLVASAYMERFDIRKEYDDGWLQQIAAGRTYVTPEFEHDEYGDFLSAHAPIYDSQGRYSGFVGVDFDMQYYSAQEARFRAISAGSLVAALVLALVIGLLMERYHSAMRHRMDALYESSIRDSLTGLLNRRGAVGVINKSLAHNVGSNATLLIDVDNLKMINDRRGHVAGDVVIACTAEVIRQSIREGDTCARIGGDEFLVFAPDCDFEGAEEIARKIVAKLSKQEMLLAGVRFGVSIGIAVDQGTEADFARMYREADEALYQARKEGKSSIGLFTPSGILDEAKDAPTFLS
jgi:diguanylate cyclase (GGDEF)-like protein